MFQLDTRLHADTFPIAELSLSSALLMDDARFPWVILVPRCADITELYELTEADQQQLLVESMTLSKAMAEIFSAHKMNVAALGNVVSQLHIHHIARFHEDVAWPGPVWNVGTRVSYSADQALARCELLRQALGAL